MVIFDNQIITFIQFLNFSFSIMKSTLSFAIVLIYNFMLSQKLELAPHIGITSTYRAYINHSDFSIKPFRKESDKFGHAFSIGMTGNYHFKNNFSVETGLTYAMRNFDILLTKFPVGLYMVPEFPQPSYTINTIYKFVEIPMFAHYNIQKEKFAFNFGLGMLNQILVGFEKDPWEKQERPKLNISPSLNIGVSKKVSENSCLKLSILGFGQLFENSDRFPHLINSIHLVGFETRIGYYITVQ